MEALKNKLKSRRGASILLAMLFLLVCMMVGTSVVMAAVSNAGKLDSVKKEQQKYLTLSSALNLLVDELENVEYKGQYNHTLRPIYETISEPVLDGDGNPTYDDDGSQIFTVTETDTVTGYEHIYQRTGGKVEGSAWLGSVLPMVNSMDAVFAKYFDGRLIAESARYPGDKFEVFIANPLSPPASYELTFTVKPDAAVQYGGLTAPVKVTVQVINGGGSGYEDGTIILTASLENEPNYRMEAVLRTEYVGLVNQFRLTADRTESFDHPTAPVKWKLDHITRK